MTYKEFIESCETGINTCKDIIIKEKINRVVISGVGIDAIPGYIINSFLKWNEIPIIVTEDYVNHDLLNHKTLVILISMNGDEEEVLSHYRIALRCESKVVVFNNKGKLKELYHKNRDVISFSHEGDFVGFSLYGILSILRNTEVFSDSKNEIRKSIDQLKEGSIVNLGLLLSKRINNKIPLIYSTKKLIGISKSWKILLNNKMNRRIFYSLIPNALHSDLATYQNRDDDFYTIIIKDEEDPRQIGYDIEEIKKIIKRNDQQVIEISLTGNLLLLRLVSALLIFDSGIDHLIKEKQQSLDEYKE